MTSKNWRHRIMRVVAAVAVGGSAFQLSGCDPAVRSTLLAGLEATTQSLTSTLVGAFFISLEDDSGSSSQLTTN